MGKREANKLERRKRIIDAARLMIQEESFSMRALAAKADVTVVTAYSLFGSRENVISAVFEEDLENFNVSLLEKGGNPLDRIFQALDLTCEAFLENSSYFHAMIKTIYRIDELYFYNRFFEPRVNFWKNLIQEAMSCKIIKRDANSSTISKQIIYLFIGSSQEWVRGAISINQMRAEIGYGISLLLLPFCYRNVLPVLFEKIIEFNNEIKEESGGVKRD